MAVVVVVVVVAGDDDQTLAPPTVQTSVFDQSPVLRLRDAVKVDVLSIGITLNPYEHLGSFAYL